MSASALPTSVDALEELLTSRGYLAERSLATVTYLALRMGRPLFLEGEAGVGKTEIARRLARLDSTSAISSRLNSGEASNPSRAASWTTPATAAART